MRLAIRERVSARLHESPEGTLLLGLALVSALVLGGRGLTDEGAVSLQGDMPRHLMNGVLMLDFLRSPAAWSINGGLDYAKEYFARYPALSLGHHPPLLPMSLVPFYGIIGVSVLAGRVAILAFFALSVVLIYSVARQRYDRTTAGWASLLFATNPFVVLFGQTVLSEMPMIAMVLLAMMWLGRFRDFGRIRDFWLFVSATGASLAAKQLAVFMVPFYAAMLLASGAWRRLIQRDVLVWVMPAGVVLGTVGVATVVLSPFNVAVVLGVMQRGVSWEQVVDTIGPIVQDQLMPSLGLVALIGILSGVVRRERRILQFMLWIVAVTAGVVFITGSIESPRYSIVALPAYCIAAASLTWRTSGLAYRVATAVLVAAVAAQVWHAWRVLPVGAGAYEEAAEYVVEATPAPTVLYSASVDTGYFVFFVRKHDPAQRMAVLRSDKLLTTSRMADISIENRIESPDEVYPLLRRYGTRYVVLEDRPSGSRVLDWLRDEARTARFAERLRVPFRTVDRRLQGVSLVVYEYLEAGAADPEAELDMNLPIVGRSIRVRLSDVVGGSYP